MLYSAYSSPIKKILNYFGMLNSHLKNKTSKTCMVYGKNERASTAQKLIFNKKHIIIEKRGKPSSKTFKAMIILKFLLLFLS